MPRSHSVSRSGTTILISLTILIAALVLRIDVRRLVSDPMPLSIQPAEDGRSHPSTPDRHVTEDIEVFFSEPRATDRAADADRKDNIDWHMARFINRAQRSVHAAIYTIDSRVVTQALIDARRRGVDVRIVMERDAITERATDAFDAAAIPVVLDNRSGLMHNKFVVVDSLYVWTGSFNPTDHGALRSNNNAIVFASAPLAENFETEFAEMFLDRQFGPRSPSRLPHNPVRLGAMDVYSYFSPEDDLVPKIIRIIRTSRVSIHFMAFAFTDTLLASWLVQRRNAGVDVQGVVETSQSAQRGSIVETMRGAGIHVLSDGKRLQMHHKVIVVDSTWTITGSYNFTNAAATSNDENIVIVKSRAVASCFEREYGRIRSMVVDAR